jgi:hypothetical protein
MFFYLTVDNSKVELLPEAYSVNSSTLFLDSGWNMKEDTNTITWRKGYSLECTMEDIHPHAQCRGHYCIIEFTKVGGEWNIYHDTLRGFPIYYNKHNITNLVPFDQTVSINDAISVTTHVALKPGHKVTFDYTPQSLSIDDAADLVSDELASNILDYIKYNNRKLCLDMSGGYDSTTLRAIVESRNIPCTIRDVVIRGLPIEQTKEPLLKYLRQTHWGYKQLRMEIRKPPAGNALVTGYMGDEFLMRNPAYVSYVLNLHGMSLYDYITKSVETTYMTDFIKTYYMEKIATPKPDGYTLDDVINALATDYQMWHYNEQIMLLPYKSKKIMEYGFSLDIDSIISQVMSATIQKTIIERSNPALLDTIYKHKNVYQNN